MRPLIFLFILLSSLLSACHTAQHTAEDTHRHSSLQIQSDSSGNTFRQLLSLFTASKEIDLSDIRIEFYPPAPAAAPDTLSPASQSPPPRASPKKLTIGRLKSEGTASGASSLTETSQSQESEKLSADTEDHSATDSDTTVSSGLPLPSTALWTAIILITLLIIYRKHLSS